MNELNCANCGKTFPGYPSASRRFCSKTCYWIDTRAHSYRGRPKQSRMAPDLAFAIDDVTAAYLAGFFDGEGSIGMYRPSFIPVMRVTGCDATPLEQFRSAFGGPIYDKGVRPKNGRDRQRQWGWDVSGRRAQAALRCLLPFLTVKRAQAELAITVAISLEGHTLTAEQHASRAELAIRMKALKRGVA